MEYSDWLIILSAMMVITFITLLGIALLEKDLKNNSLFLWISVSGLILFIVITTVLILYYHKGNTNGIKTIKDIKEIEREQKINNDKNGKPEINIDEEKDMVR